VEWVPILTAPVTPPKPRWRTPYENQQLREQTSQWHSAGVVEKAKLLWVNNPVFVAKKDGRTRVCIDCRPVNAVTQEFDWPLPRLGELRMRLAGMSWFSRIDLTDAFFRIQIPKLWRYVTGYESDGTRYQFTKMPFGLKTAPAVFQRFMDHTLGTLARICYWYMDDIIIYATTLSQLKQRTAKVKRALTRAGNKINENKSEYDRSGLLFAGLWIYSGGQGPNHAKVQAVQALPLPRTKVEKQSALGLVSYLRDHIPLAAHFTAALYPGKGQTLNEEEYEKEWRKLTHHVAKRITTLGHWDDSRDATVYTDASGTGLGVVLIQDGRIVALTSRKLKPAETRYSTTDREHLSLMHAAKTMKIFLHRPRGATRVMNDHAALIGRKHTEMLPRQARWAEIINQWIPNVEFVPGISNPADFISRWSIEVRTGGVDMSTKEKYKY